MVSNVHLVVQKAVHLQYISGLDDSVPGNSLFQKVHNEHLLKFEGIIAQGSKNVSGFSKKRQAPTTFGIFHTLRCVPGQKIGTVSGNRFRSGPVKI